MLTPKKQLSSGLEPKSFKQKLNIMSKQSPSHVSMIFDDKKDPSFSISPSSKTKKFDYKLQSNRQWNNESFFVDQLEEERGNHNLTQRILTPVIRRKASREA